MTVNIHEAKTNLSKLIAFLEKGEEIIIAKAGNPVAKLITYRDTSSRTPNTLKGKVTLHDSFESADEEIRMLFEESE